MKNILESRAKTIPSNYCVVPVEVSLELAPGATLDDEAWAKHERQCSPYYDWGEYQKIHERVLDTIDHPEYAKKVKEQILLQQWSELLDELEPFDPRG